MHLMVNTLKTKVKAVRNYQYQLSSILKKLNRMSSRDNDDTQLMHSKSDNIEIMIVNKTDGIINELFESFLTRYQLGLESMKGNDFVFDSIDGMHYKCNKISLNCGGVYIDSIYRLDKQQKSNDKPRK